MKQASTPISDVEGYLPWETVKRIIASAADHPRNHLFLRTLAFSGRRVSEVLHLKPSNLSQEDVQIAFRVLKKKKPTVLWFVVDRKLYSALREYASNTGMDRLDKYFRFTRQTGFNIVRRYGKKAGVEWVGNKRIHPHHFRHSYAVHLIKCGVPLRTVQKLLAHSDITMTAHYLQFSTEDVKEQLEGVFD